MASKKAKLASKMHSIPSVMPLEHTLDATPPENNLLSKDDLEVTGLPSRVGKACKRIEGESAAHEIGNSIEMSQRFIVTRKGFFDVMQQLAPQSNMTDERKRFYFRGEACSQFSLLPTLLRDNVYGRLSRLHETNGPIELQKKLLDRYRRYTQHLIHSDNDFSAPIWEDFDTLCLAQHHGLPTLLMDWTLNPYVAAYFAISEAYRTLVREKLSAHRGITKYWVRVWVMRLKKPNQRRDFTVHLEDRKKEWDKLLGDMMLVPSAPLIVVPLVFTRRIAAQAGRFVYCGYMANEFQDTNPPISKSLARFSWEHSDNNSNRGTSLSPQELGWDQLYSLDVEFDIGAGTDSYNLWHNEQSPEKQFSLKLESFRSEMMKMMSDLEFIGFHAGRLFPDLEGWARYLAEGNL